MEKFRNRSLRFEKLEEKQMLSLDAPMDTQAEMASEYYDLLNGINIAETSLNPIDTSEWNLYGNIADLGNGSVQIKGGGYIESHESFTASPDSPVNISFDVIPESKYQLYRTVLHSEDGSHEISLDIRAPDRLYLCIPDENGDAMAIDYKKTNLDPWGTYHIDMTVDGNTVTATVTNKSNPEETFTLSGEYDTTTVPHFIRGTTSAQSTVSSFGVEQASNNEAITDAAIEQITEENTPVENNETEISPLIEPIIETVTTERQNYLIKIPADSLNPIDTSIWQIQGDVNDLGNGAIQITSGGYIESHESFTASPDSPVNISFDVIPESQYQLYRTVLHSEDGSHEISLDIRAPDRLYLCVPDANGDAMAIDYKKTAMDPRGTYQVTMTVDGNTVTATVTNKSNPDETFTLSGDYDTKTIPHFIRGTTIARSTVSSFSVEQASNEAVTDAAIEQAAVDGSNTNESQEISNGMELIPSIKVMRIEGPNVILRIQSPADYSCVEIGGGGILDTHTQTHEGGTLFAGAHVTFNADNGIGYYTIYLRDAEGKALDTISVYWDGSTLVVSDASDMWSPSDYVETLNSRSFIPVETGVMAESIKQEIQYEAMYIAAEELAATEISKQSFVNDVYISNALVRNNQNNDLYAKSSFSVSSSDAEELFYQVHPHYSDENINDYITQQWEQSTGSTRGQIQDQIVADKLDLLARAQRGVNAYNSDMQNIVFPAAIDVFAGIRQGRPESELIETFNSTYACLSGFRCAEFYSLTGFTKPSSNSILNSAKAVYFEQTDIFEHYQSEDERILSQTDRDYERVMHEKWVAAVNDSTLLAIAQDLTEEELLARQERNGTIIAGRYQNTESTQQVASIDASEQRRLDRAERLVTEYLANSTNSRIELVRAEQGQDVTNIQRVAYTAEGTVQFTVTSEELRQVDEQFIDSVASGTDTQGVLYAAAGDLIVDTGIEEIIETNAQVEVQNAIQERVTARLNERLDSMTVEERAEARGLLRLKEDGKLDEYFAALFNGENSEAVEAELGDGSGYRIYYLLDTDVLGGIGHAAMIMGSDSEGWYYFSFGMGTVDQGNDRFFTSDGNMDVEFYSTLEEARSSKKLNRYEYFLSWGVSDVSSIRSAFKEASKHLSTEYRVFENCDDIASYIIRAAGVQLDDSWIPAITLQNNIYDADDCGEWPLISDQLSQ